MRTRAFVEDDVRRDGGGRFARQEHADAVGGMSALPVQRPWREARAPYDGPEIDGHLSLNSYAATAVFGVTELAAEVLHENGQRLTGATVRALTSMFSRIIMDAQASITHGNMDWQSGANVRIRGALRTALRTMPIPFGGNADDWNRWRADVTRRCISIASVAIELYDHGPSDDDVAILTSTTPVPPAR